MQKLSQPDRLDLLCEEKANNRSKGFILFACFCSIFAAYTIRYSYGCLLPEMLPALSITKAQAGIIFASYFTAYTVFAPILGLMADRFNSRLIILVFVLVMGAGTFLMQYAGSLMQATVFFTLSGVGGAACWAPVMALAQRWINGNRRGLTLALIDAGSSLGVVAAGTLIPAVVMNGRWQNGWFALGIMTAVISIINFFFLYDHPRQNNPGQVSSAAKSGDKKIFTDRRFWFIGTAYVFNCFVVIIPFAFISTYAVQELAFSYTSATLLITVMGLTGTAGKLLLGPLSDKIGRIRMIILCAFLLCAGSLGMSFSKGPALFFFAGIFGVGYGACWSLYAACAGDFFPGVSTGFIIGLWTCYSGIGSICGPILGGLSADISGTLGWSFIIGAAGGLVSLLLLIPMLKERQINIE